MASYLVRLAALCTVTLAQEMCNYKAPEQNIDWDRVKLGPWKWSVYTSDEFQDTLACSPVNIVGDSNVSFAMQFQFGPAKHQVYLLKGDYQSAGQYKIGDFASSWRRIVTHTLPFALSKILLDEEIDIPRKENAVFYTDYKNYFISVICMPNGRMSVAAFTMHARTTPMLAKRINNVLFQNNIFAVTTKASCRLIQRRRGAGKTLA